MSVNYGRPASPEGVVIGRLMPLGLPVGVERSEDDPLPSYVVTAFPGTSDRRMLTAIVSVASFGATRAEAEAAAWAADDQLISGTPGDVITLPDGSTATAWIDPYQTPAWDNYDGDPYLKRYVARYRAFLRFSQTR